MVAFPRIDRAAHLRKDVDRLMAALDAPDTVLVPVWRGQVLLSPGAGSAALLDAGEASTLVDDADELVWLGLLGTRHCFALDLSSLGAPAAHPALAGRVEPSDLRMAGSVLEEPEAELLAYARGMLQWHAQHRYCGACGSPTRARDGGHVRECEADGQRHFPRTDPAVMVLVSHADRCLLARQPGWPEGMYSALAGFVEPGESAEDAVRREVREEVGLAVSELRYFRSQPWPFPRSLMLGMRARAATAELSLDGDELEDARWVTREELESPRGFFYPPRFSLAHHLIRAFMDEGPGDG